MMFLFAEEKLVVRTPQLFYLSLHRGRKITKACLSSIGRDIGSGRPVEIQRPKCTVRPKVVDLGSRRDDPIPIQFVNSDRRGAVGTSYLLSTQPHLYSGITYITYTTSSCTAVESLANWRCNYRSIGSSEPSLLVVSGKCWQMGGYYYLHGPGNLQLWRKYGSVPEVEFAFSYWLTKYISISLNSPVCRPMEINTTV